MSWYMPGAKPGTHRRHRTVGGAGASVVELIETIGRKEGVEAGKTSPFIPVLEGFRLGFLLS
jgi:hypothetical protein